MFLKYIYLLIISTIFLASCNSPENATEKITANSTKDENINIPINKNDSLENKLLPPKFNITHFEMDYVAENKELIFFMNYEIDTEIYEILQSNDQMIYFSLEYPVELYDVFESISSELLLAEKPNGYNTKYRVQFKKQIDLNASQLEKIKGNISGFNLIIADKDKDAIAHFIDLNGFNNFVPDISKSTHFDETNN